MSDHDPLTDGLRTLAALDGSQPDLQAVRDRVMIAIAAELTDVAADRTGMASHQRRRPARTAVLALLSVTVTAAVIAVVLLLPADRAGAPAGPVGSPASAVPTTSARLPSRPTRRLLIREDSHEHHRAPVRLLSAFTALRGPVPRTKGGATVSHPPLSAIPTQILELASPRRRNHIDISRIRRVALRSGIDVWILPGSRSLCTAVAAPVHGQATLVWGGGCVPAGPAERKPERLNIEHGSEGVIAGVLPSRYPTITIQIHGRRRTLTPKLGVYAQFRHHQ